MERQEIVRIRHLGDEILKDLVKEQYFNHEPKLRDSIENLARSIVALSDIALEQDQYPENTLRYVVSKMKQASNAIKEQGESKIS